jgi:hypothetical protein
MPANRSAKKNSTPNDGADPRFVPVTEALARTFGFSLMESKSGAMRGLMLNGKSFGMSSHGRFILKLTEERTAALVADGIGKPFSPSAGRVMKGWIEITREEADWVSLAKEAHRLAAAAQKPPAKTSKRPGAGRAPPRVLSGRAKRSKIDD